MTITIVSGGQTGVDQGALEAALLEGIAAGGLCPENRRDEHGPIPERYAAHLHPVAATAALAFILRHSIVILNVAGPRISDWAEGFGFTRDVMTQVLRNLGTSSKP